MEKRGIWKLRPLGECWQRTGREPVSVRWVDTNKGKEGRMEVRSRMVARDFKGKANKRDDLFADTAFGEQEVVVEPGCHEEE